MDKLLDRKLVEDAVLLKHVPLLQKSLSGEWGYVYEELIDLSYSGGPEANRFMSYFYSKALNLTDSKVRILKIIHKLAFHGSRTFRNLWRESRYDEILREYSNSGGISQRLSKETREYIFSDEVVNKDSDESLEEVTPRLSHSYSGHGSSNVKDKKYDGFGKDSITNKESWTDKLRDLVEESLVFTNEKSRIIEECLSSESPGDYVAVNIPQTSSTLISSSSPDNSKLKKSSPTHKAHIKGRAGGGWESDEEEEKIENRIEETYKVALNMSTSELVVEMREDMKVNENNDISINSLESMEINSFCDIKKPLKSYIEADEVVQKIRKLNILTSLSVLKSKLLSETSNEQQLHRTLILIEQLLTLNLTRPNIYKEAFSESLVMLSNKFESLKFKALKINLWIDALLL
ncbi:uncharacterized protein [Lepeophtheirus salmonis]|uniref:uncharacterized protein n=1 Tax=Lepeophtheirus salmonis TaxID=72036 RepID=UPI001AE9302F|nr:AP-4 complex accessory subunit tepsin-like [Lepeophtheirus salmonis]